MDTKTSKTAFNIYKTFNLRRTLNIRKILLPLDGRSGIYRVRKACEDKAGGPVLDIEEVTVLLSINTKG